MSSGFCCAAKAPASNPASNNVSPKINTARVFVTIPGILYLSFLDCLSSTTFSSIQMPNRAPLVHLTVTGPYRID
jgi:hypothetical protein